MLSRLSLPALLMLAVSSLAEAQNMRNPAAMQMQQIQPVEITGTVEAAAMNRLQVLDDSQQTWMVAVPPKAKVQVTGMAKKDFLRPGVFVELKAEVDNRGTIKEKVAELTIVMPTQDKPVGVFPADAAAGDAKAGDAKAGNAKLDEQNPFGAGMAAGKGAGKGAPKGADKLAGPAGAGKAGGMPASGGMYRIVGRLAGGKAGKFSLDANCGKVQFELTDEPSIGVDTIDYTLASKGDKVTIKGKMMAGRAGLAQADEVKIELAEPLTGMKKKNLTLVKPEPKHPAKSPKKDEGLPAPAEEK